MLVTVPEFDKITGVSKNTVYSWIYRNTLPVGISVADIGISTKVLKITSSSEYYELIKKAKEKAKK